MYKPVYEYGDSAAKVELVEDSEGCLGAKSSSHLIHNFSFFKNMLFTCGSRWEAIRE